MSKNVVANFPVSVEFNQTYKLLLVSCLLDQKKFFFHDKRKYSGWINITKKNGTRQVFWK